MQRAAIGLLILPLGLVCGCGETGSRSALPPPPRGGNIIELPGSRGFVELKTDSAAPSAGGLAQPGKSQLKAYFYQPDATTAMSPAPSSVKVTLASNVINLAPNSAVPGEFASEPGNYPRELRGQIDFQLEGGPVQVPFSFR